MAEIAISLPDDVLEAVEKEHIDRGISRSEYLHRTVEEHLHRENEKEDVSRYIQGYIENPETPEEMARVEATLHYAFDEESWEEQFNK